MGKMVYAFFACCRLLNSLWKWVATGYRCSSRLLRIERHASMAHVGPRREVMNVKALERDPAVADDRAELRPAVLILTPGSLWDSGTAPPGRSCFGAPITVRSSCYIAQCSYWV